MINNINSQLAIAKKPTSTKNGVTIRGHEQEEVAAVVPVEEGKWDCHCCRAKNVKSLKACRVCGRSNSYAIQGFSLPLHGEIGLTWRPEQVSVLLLDDVNIADIYGWTSLHQASVRGNYEIVEELIRLEAFVDSVTAKGQTALHLAIQRGCIKTIELLVANGHANVNICRSGDNYSPLHIACDCFRKDICKYLLRKGAYVDALDIMERTPLHTISCAGGDRADIAALLLKEGANDTAVDVHGWSPRQIAELANNRAIQELLVRHGMTEKIAVIRKMLVAPWHCQLWDDVTTGFHRLKEEAIMDKLKKEEDRKEALMFMEKFASEAKLRRQHEQEQQEIQLKKEMQKEKERVIKKERFKEQKRLEKESRSHSGSSTMSSSSSTYSICDSTASVSTPVQHQHPQHIAGMSKMAASASRNYIA